MVYTAAQKRDHIREAQKYLRAISFFDDRVPSIGVDGIYGPETEEAVAAYQRARGLRVTGTINRETWAYLVKEYDIIHNLQGSPKFINPFPSISHEIGPGEKGSIVFILQIMLDTIGKAYTNLSPVPVDGVYGSRTEEAVREFQRFLQRPATGLVDKTDWDLIANTYNARLEEASTPNS